MSIFDKFNSSVDLTALHNDVVKAGGSNTKTFEPTPHGVYEVHLTKAEIKESKTGKPMLAMQFKIVSGDCKGKIVFYNQVISTGFGVHMANQFLASLITCSVKGIKIDFVDYKQYNDLVLDILEESQQFDYCLKYTANAKNPNFSDYEITDTYNVE